MRFATEGPISPRVAAQVAVFLVFGYAVLQLTGRLGDGPRQTATVAPPTPKPGADDPLNRVILIEGGTFLSGSDDWEADLPVGSPFSKEDEFPRRRTVAGFWMQEHEVTNEEYLRFDAGARVLRRAGAAPRRQRHLARSHGLRRFRGGKATDRATVGVRGERLTETGVPVGRLGAEVRAFTFRPL